MERRVKKITVTGVASIFAKGVNHCNTSVAPPHIVHHDLQFFFLLHTLQFFFRRRSPAKSVFCPGVCVNKTVSWQSLWNRCNRFKVMPDCCGWFQLPFGQMRIVLISSQWQLFEQQPVASPVSVGLLHLVFLLVYCESGFYWFVALSIEW